MKTKLLYFALVVVTTIYLVSCGNDDEKPQTVPTVTTNETIVTTTSTATVSGEITDDGNASISEAGFVYSSIVENPTTSENKKTVTDFDDFEAELTGLTSGTTYNVRAYAINKKGTAYGEKRTFLTGNLAPVVSNIQITGDVEVNKTVTADYTYEDAEGDPEGESVYQWYAANDAAGAGEAAISGATEKTFHIAEAQNGKFLRVTVLPKAESGTITGVEATSLLIGAVGEATTVTFTYNGQEVTYGIISRPSGKKWMDRNLGATRAAQSVDDYLAYGDLFQWGRLADGHQLVTRTGVSDGNASAVHESTSSVAPFETSNIDVPGHFKFIINGNVNSGDWRTTKNSNLWQGASGTNNPCPSGWRIPTLAEWTSEGLASSGDGYTKLKITFTGYRDFTSGNFLLTATDGMYWSSTPEDSFGAPFTAYRMRFTASAASNIDTYRANAFACRCIKQ